MCLGILIVAEWRRKQWRWGSCQERSRPGREQTTRTHHPTRECFQETRTFKKQIHRSQRWIVIVHFSRKLCLQLSFFLFDHWYCCFGSGVIVSLISKGFSFTLTLYNDKHSLVTYLTKLQYRHDELNRDALNLFIKNNFGRDLDKRNISDLCKSVAGRGEGRWRVRNSLLPCTYIFHLCHVSPCYHAMHVLIVDGFVR